MTTESNKPDFYVYVKSGTAKDAPLNRVGAAWKHRQGNGLNITVSANSVTGNYVLFPPKAEEKP